MCAGKLQIERGRLRNGHETLGQARALPAGDAAVTLEIDRLDGQALLRLGEWTSGEALLNTVVTRAAATADRYHQATALNDLGRGLIARTRFDEALPYFERVVAIKSATASGLVASPRSTRCFPRIRIGGRDIHELRAVSNRKSQDSACPRISR